MERPHYLLRGFKEEASLWRGFIEDASLWRGHIKICGEVPPKRPLHSEVVLERPLMPNTSSQHLIGGAQLQRQQL